MSDQTTAVSTLPPAALIESLLFVASEPVPLTRLAKLLGLSKGAIRTAVNELENDCRQRGLRLQWIGETIQFVTAPEASHIIEKFLGLTSNTARLSQAALEVLGIIAYLQPITRPQVDDIRGVNSDGALRTLLSKGLLEEIGRLEAPGRPILYGTTAEFMQHFGLSNLTELPPLEPEQSKEMESKTQVTS